MSSKGKIERWFRTVRAQFLRHLGNPEALDLEQINQRLNTWVEAEYHQTPHRGLDEDRSPYDQWVLTSHQVRPLRSTEELEQLLCRPYRRKISADHVLRFRGRDYELRDSPVQVTATLLVDPLAPPERPIPVEYQGQLIGCAKLLQRSANNRRPRRRQQTAAREAEPAPPPQLPRLQLSELPRSSPPSASGAAQPAPSRQTTTRPPTTPPKESAP